MIVGSDHFGVSINIGAPFGCCPFHILPSLSSWLPLHLPAHLRQTSS